MMTPSGVHIVSLVFGQGGVEVSYVHEAETDSVTGIQETRSVAIPAHIVPDALGDLMDSIDQVLKETAVARRQPPPTRQK